jgi:hypothetical protein
VLGPWFSITITTTCWIAAGGAVVLVVDEVDELLEEVDVDVDVDAGVDEPGAGVAVVVVRPGAGLGVAIVPTGRGSFRRFGCTRTHTRRR